MRESEPWGGKRKQNDNSEIGLISWRLFDDNCSRANGAASARCEAVNNNNRQIDRWFYVNYCKIC